MNCTLVHGLRQSRVDDGGAWFERLTSAIKGEWPVQPTLPRTQCAEHGLGIAGNPYYFYALPCLAGAARPPLRSMLWVKRKDDSRDPMTSVDGSKETDHA